MDTVLFGVCASVLVLALGMNLARHLRDRADRRENERALRRSLEAAVAELALTPPAPKPDGGFVSSGTIAGLPARLEVGGRGHHRVSVVLAAVGLPAEVVIASRPRGRDSEVFALGGAVDAGVVDFDRGGFALFGDGVHGDALVAAARRVDPALLQRVAAWAEPRIKLTSRALTVDPGPPNLAWGGPNTPRWRASSGDLVALWRRAEQIVDDGVARGLFRPV